MCSSCESCCPTMNWLKLCITARSLQLVWRHSLLIWVAWLALGATPGHSAAMCNVQQKTVQGNIIGDVLVLSAGSLAYEGPHPAEPAITNAAACAHHCGLLPDCNAWTFCSKRSGCSNGCSAWAKQHPKLPQGGPEERNPIQADLPVTGFGPWTFPHNANGCQYSFDTDSTSDAWPYGLCTLKRVRNPQSPPLYSQPNASTSSDGWVSGTISVSLDCKGLPANVCKGCGASNNPGACLKCARDPAAQFSKKPIRYIINSGNKVQDTCAICANLTDTTQHNRCLECILGNKPCSTCVYGAQMWGYGKPNIAACLACTTKKGPMYAGACNACAQSKEPDRCFTCLDTFPLKFCKQGEVKGTNACQVLPNDQTPCDLCSNSAKSDDVYKQCLNCYRNPNWEQECSSCGSIATKATDQARCYDCVQKTKFSSYKYYGCSSCFASWVLPGQTPACLACVENSGTPMAAKSSCSSCVDASQQRFNTTQAACFNCLKTQQQDHQAACLNEGGRKLLLLAEQ